jgi:hypothetical protein
MLQIASGKFFQGVAVHETEHCAIFYSNYSCGLNMSTTAGVLEPVETIGVDVTSYLFRFKIRLPRRGGSLELVSVGRSELAHQFRLLCVAVLGAYFASERTVVELRCRQTSRGGHDQYVPSAFVSRVFDRSIQASSAEIEKLQQLVFATMALPRSHFRAAMSFLEMLLQSLEALETNLDLAYSMLVYGLESLSQSFDNFNPSWEDYPQETRRRIDKILELEGARAFGTSIRSALLEDAHVRLTQRFVAFTIEHLDSSFFQKEAEGLLRPVRMSELRHVLAAAYSTRSGYVHRLVGLHRHLHLSEFAKGEVFVLKGLRYLSYRGLLRIALHVWKSFVLRQSLLASEAYDWESELPGVIRVPLAPRYWVGRVPPSGTQFSRDQRAQYIKSQFEGFVEILLGHPKGERLPDMRHVLIWAGRSFDGLNVVERRRVVATCKLFNSLARETDRIRGWSDFVSKQEHLWREPSMEGMIMWVLTETHPDWSMPDSFSMYEDFHRDRFSKTALRIPLSVEVAILLKLANGHLAVGDCVRFGALVARATRELTGQGRIQGMLTHHLQRLTEVDVSDVLRILLGTPLRSDEAPLGRR